MHNVQTWSINCAVTSSARKPCFKMRSSCCRSTKTEPEIARLSSSWEIRFIVVLSLPGLFFQPRLSLPPGSFSLTKLLSNCKFIRSVKVLNVSYPRRLWTSLCVILNPLLMPLWLHHTFSSAGRCRVCHGRRCQGTKGDWNGATRAASANGGSDQIQTGGEKSNQPLLWNLYKSSQWLCPSAIFWSFDRLITKLLLDI